MDFKDRIKAVRLENGVSPAQLAAYLNKSESAVRAWEIERSKPDADTLIILSKYFNCTTDYLLGLSDHRNSNEKAEISTSSNDLEEAVLKMDNGRDLLEGLVQFFQIATEREDYSYVITSAYLKIAQYIAPALDEIYAFQVDFESTRVFSLERFLKCYSLMSEAVAMANSNMNLISDFPFEKIMNLVSAYGLDAEKNIVSSFYRTYHSSHEAPSPDTAVSKTGKKRVGYGKAKPGVEPAKAAATEQLIQEIHKLSKKKGD